MEIPDVKIPRKVLNTHDLTAKRNEWILTPPAPVVKYLKHILKEERDLPIGHGLYSALADFLLLNWPHTSTCSDVRVYDTAYLLVNVTCMTLPAAALVLYVGSNWLGFAYMLSNLLLFQERFILALHFSSHRRLTDNVLFNAIPTHILSPFFGIPSGISETERHTRTFTTDICVLCA